MKQLIIFIMLFSVSAFAKSTSAPEGLYNHQKIKQEKLANGDYSATFTGSSEGLAILKDKAKRLATMESLSCETQEIDGQLIVIIKKSVDMDTVIERILNDLI